MLEYGNTMDYFNSGWSTYSFGSDWVGLIKK